MAITESPAEHSLLLAQLRRGPASAPDLARASGLSDRQVRRVLAGVPSLRQAGRAGRTRYAQAKPLRGEVASWPLYAIDAQGHVAPALCEFSLIEPHGSLCPLGEHMPCFDTATDPTRDGWWGGLPYAVYNMQPQGYLGRQFARAWGPSLHLPTDPREWGDDHVAVALSQRGSDTSGNLILGDASLERFLRLKLAPPAVADTLDLPQHYTALADIAIGQGDPGRSAAGEFPKFTALRAMEPGDLTPHVIVKFSSAQDPSSPNATTQRWADLLVCEHLALRTLCEIAPQQPHLRAARSRVVSAHGRTFLEVERFDRLGLHGRLPLVSLQAASDCLLGLGGAPWPLHAKALADRGWLTLSEVRASQMLWWFGTLIGNSDMHTGNLSLRWHAGGFSLAPAYDMLPMAYSPLPGGELRNPQPQTQLPKPQEREVWHISAQAAQAFWQSVRDDSRISHGMRAHAVVAMESLRHAVAVA